MAGTVHWDRVKILPNYDTKGWWEANKRREYVVSQCNTCGNRWFPPLPACHKCHSMDVGWFKTQGKGVIYSYVVVVQPIFAHFADAVPYVVAVIELPDANNPEGYAVRVAGVLRDEEAAVAIGLPVDVDWEETPDPEIVIPFWRISGTAEGTWKFPG